MRKSAVLISLLLWASSLTHAQTVTEQWVARYNAANSLDEASSLAIDNEGYVYVTGRSAGLGTGNDYLTIKYNPDGSEAWVTRTNFGVNGNDFAHDIAVDNAGGIYVTGQGFGDFATVKYNSATGDTIWTRTYRSNPNGIDYGAKIALDGSGNIYVTGSLGGSANPATLNIGTIKYNSNGDSVWVRIFDGANNVDTPADMFVDQAGNVYITGRSDTVGTVDAITLKYNTNGELKWQRRFGTSPVLNAVAVDDDGNVYVTGRDGNAAVTIKYDSSGVEQWVALIDDPLYGERFVDIATDGSNVYVFGSRSGLYMTAKYYATGDTAWTRFQPASGGGNLPQPFAITLDDFNNVYVTGRRGTSASGANYLTVKYSTTGHFQWSQEYNGPGNNSDEARDIAVEQNGNVYVTGGSWGGATTREDYATIKYGQPGSEGPTECWSAGTFDNLSPGSLNGQDEWITVPGRSDAFVVANPFGAGQVLRMDAAPNETVIMGKDVNDQHSGIQRIKLNVLVDGNSDPAEPTLAKVEIRTTGNPNWDKKFQLYFGAHMRLNFGPTLQDAQVFLAAMELVKRQWYEVEAVVDMSSNTVDIFLDGVLKLDNIAVGPGAITDIGISAWDRPGLVYYDNLEFCNLTPPQPGECPVTSFFDVDDEGWTVIEDVQPPVHFLTGGNPGGYISATDIGIGQRWYWQAPAKFLGDLSCAYDKALNFDLRHLANNHGVNHEDVILEGSGLKLVFANSHTPDENWTAYSVSLNENAGWKKDNSNGVPPTHGEMQSVLASLTNMLIRGEFSIYAGDIGHLDNVVMGGPLKGVGPLECRDFYIVWEESDEDGSMETGEIFGIGIVLKNQGIATATSITGTLTSSEPRVISFGDSTGTWPDIAAGDSAGSIDNFAVEVNPDLTQAKHVTLTLTINAANGGPWICTMDVLVSPENLPPVVANAIPDTTVAPGDSSFTRDLNVDPAVFNDPDQDLTALTYSVTSSDSAKAIATISGSALTVAGIDTGFASITITADDGRGGTAQTSFGLQVSPPTGIKQPDSPPIVRELRVEQNCPNPFNPETEIRFALPEASHVVVKIFNALGAEIRTLTDIRYGAGYHSVRWDGKSETGNPVASGIYFYKLEAGGFSQVRQMILLR